MISECPRDSQDSSSQSSGPRTSDEERNSKSLSLRQHQKLMEANPVAALRKLASTKWREQGCIIFGREVSRFQRVLCVQQIL